MKKQTLFTLMIFLCFAGWQTANAQIYTYGSNDVYTTDQFGIDKSNALDQLHIEAYGDRCIRLEEDGSGTEHMIIGVDNSGDLNIIRDNGYTALSILDYNGNIGVGTTSPKVKLDVVGDIATSSAHRRGKIRMWHENNSSDAYVSHAFGTEHLHNTYGPGVSYGNSIGHKFYVRGNDLAAQIGVGGGGAYYARRNSYFYGNVYFYGGIIQGSDKKLKSDIKDLGYGLKEILRLRPVSYVMKKSAGEKRLGLIAQELQPVMGELVSSTKISTESEDGTKSVENDYLGVNYVELIPVLIKGMQEQQALIEEQATRIDQLEAQISGDSGDQGNTSPRPNSNGTNVVPQRTGKVFQNNPNPFKNSTRISYELPENVRQANLLITDMTGKQVASYELTGQSIGEVTVNAVGLSNGTYVYVLVVDGKPVAQNKMVIAK